MEGYRIIVHNANGAVIKLTSDTSLFVITSWTSYGVGIKKLVASCVTARLDVILTHKKLSLISKNKFLLFEFYERRFSIWLYFFC